VLASVARIGTITRDVLALGRLDRRHPVERRGRDRPGADPTRLTGLSPFLIQV
jgi:hypothetical protein